MPTKLRIVRQPRQPPPADLLDISFALAQIRLEAQQLSRFFVIADECGAARGPTLRAHIDDLRRLQGEIAALVAEAETEAA
jgi:hypothetical protein